MGAGYRLRQFWRAAMAASPRSSEWTDIESALSPLEVELFRRLSRSDRAHSLRVMRTLQAAGHDHPDLLAAALLHDVGKSRLGLPIWLRPLSVLAEAAVPQRAARWGQGQETGWRRPFVIKARHPAWGAELVRAAGSRPLTVALVARHQERLPDGVDGLEEQLRRHLRWADDLN